MADEVAESSRSRRMDLNPYSGLSPLPRPRGRDLSLDIALGFSPPSNPSLPTEGIIHYQAGVLDSSETSVYSPSNVLSATDQFPVDSYLASVDNPGSDNEESFDNIQPAALLFDTSFPHVSVSLPPLAEMPNNDVPLVSGGNAHGRHLRISLEASPVRPVQTVRLSDLANRGDRGDSQEQLVASPEFRLRRLIQVNEQHQAARSRQANRRSDSPETDRLIGAIMHSKSSLDARKRKLDGNDNIGADSDPKEGDCGCSVNFECNICLEAAKEPVVAPCGHLFCWPCLYQWLHVHALYSECPVCKGEVFEVSVTPIYGRGGGERDDSCRDIPPRPHAKRREGLRQQLQTLDSRRSIEGIESMLRRLVDEGMPLGSRIEGQGGPQVPPVRFEAVDPTVLPRARSRRLQREQRSAFPPVLTLVQQVAANRSDTGSQGSANLVPLPSSDARSAVPWIPRAPQHSSSADRASTSSTMAVIMGDTAPPTDEVTEPNRAGSLASTRSSRRRRRR